MKFTDIRFPHTALFISPVLAASNNFVTELYVLL